MTTHKKSDSKHHDKQAEPPASVRMPTRHESEPEDNVPDDFEPGHPPVVEKPPDRPSRNLRKL